MKQIYEEKKVINLCGRLDKDGEGNYKVTVEDKDSCETYDLNDILENMEGQLVSIKSDIF